MLVKIVIIFLAAMAGLAMLGRYLFPGFGRRKPPLDGKPRARFSGTTICNSCGRPILGKDRCDCDTSGGTKGTGA